MALGRLAATIDPRRGFTRLTQDLGTSRWQLGLHVECLHCPLHACVLLLTALRPTAGLNKGGSNKGRPNKGGLTRGV